MSTTEIRGGDTPARANVQTVDMKLEVVVVPVSDVDRSKRFYESVGWRLDGDFRRDNGFRGIQFTPTGSGCSIQFGTKVTSAAPGSAQSLHLIVSDIGAARELLVSRGVDVSGVLHCESEYACRYPGNGAPVPGPHPERLSYGSFATFSDPDGNSWVLQEVTTRLPGRVGGNTTFASVRELSEALERAAAAHGEHERRTGQADPDWPAWYANHMVREQSGEELST